MKNIFVLFLSLMFLLSMSVVVFADDGGQDANVKVKVEETVAETGGYGEEKAAEATEEGEEKAAEATEEGEEKAAEATEEGEEKANE